MGCGDATQRATSSLERELEEMQCGVGASPYLPCGGWVKVAAVAVGFPAIYVNDTFLSPAVQILQSSLAVSGDTLGRGQSILPGLKLLIPAALRWWSPCSIFPCHGEG